MAGCELRIEDIVKMQKKISRVLVWGRGGEGVGGGGWVTVWGGLGWWIGVWVEGLGM